jgi:hypothetical protein
MKTTLMSLNEKLAVLADIKDDADNFKASFNESENIRGNQQVQIVRTSESIAHETRLHDDKHSEKIRVIQLKDSEIQ